MFYEKGTARKKEFSIEDFLSKCDYIGGFMKTSFLRSGAIQV